MTFINNTIDCDLLIVGAGSAGIAAAVAANNLKIVIIDMANSIGGTASLAAVGTICGAFKHQATHAEYLYSGFIKEFITSLTSSSPICFKDSLWFVPYDEQEYISLAKKYLAKKNIQIILNEQVTHVKQTDLDFTANTNLGREIKAGYIIDASANCVVASNFAKFKLSEQVYQAGALVAEIIFKAPFYSARDFQFELISAILDQELNSNLKFISIVPGSESGNKFRIKFPIESTTKNNLAAYKDAVVSLENTINILNKRTSGCELNWIAPKLGIRSGEKVLGQYLLTREDILAARKFSNAVARSSWPIEFWPDRAKLRLEKLPINDYAEIPVECLKLKETDRIFLAGLNISTDSDACASTRVIANCLATGYAAGKLVFGKVNQICEKEIIKKIQSEILDG